MYIDEKFKDSTPEETVAKIQKILAELGIEYIEGWGDSGIENCYSAAVRGVNGLPSTNGKGITKELARASAHAEFIERLQAGLYLVLYQSAMRDPGLDFHANAPDGKFMTVEELIENGDWMDHIINSYKDPRITRKSIAMNCKAYACADDGKIWTVPYFSIFENKFVYLPTAFIDLMYRTNGNCAGNTKEEAWVHALSEIMERNASKKLIMSGKSYPALSEETLQSFPTVSKIINQIRESGNYDVKVFDCSIGNGFPVIATRVINKNDQTYLVNVGADPILEIAVERTMTELFQGRSLDKLRAIHSSKILNKLEDFPIISNVFNHTQTSDGMYTADFFCEELTCDRKVTDFPDNTDKNNKELLTYMLNLYRDWNLPIYVRNYSFLGFPSYKFVVPGFSESRALTLTDLVPEYALSDSVAKTFRDVTKASNLDLNLMLSYSNKIKTVYRQYTMFSSNAGIPLERKVDTGLTGVTRAYAYYKLGNLKQTIIELAACKDAFGEEHGKYLRCVCKYLQMKVDGISDDKIKIILYKFFKKQYPDMLYFQLNKGLTPFEEYVMKCDFTNCEKCRYKEHCCYDYFKWLTATLGERYKAFVDGQDRSEFKY